MKLAKQALKNMLTRLSADSAKAKELAKEFLKEGIISKIVHDEVIRDPKSLTKVLIDVIDAQPELLTNVVDVLRKDEMFQHAVAELS